MTFDSKSLLTVDVETTGPDPFVHQLLAASIVPFDLNVKPITIYVRHDAQPTWTEPARTFFQRYRTEWSDRAVPPEQAAQELSDYLLRLAGPKEFSLVGHNVGFDLSFLKGLWPGRAIPRVSHRTIDTHTMLRVLAWMGRVPESACTSSGAFEYFGVAQDARTRHTALGDALATRELFLRLMEEFGGALGVAAPSRPSRRIGGR